MVIVLSADEEGYTVSDVMYRDGFGWYRIASTNSTITYDDIQWYDPEQILSVEDPFVFPEREKGG